ncbi:MAG: DUF1854 domain-containing protein [Armatimonadetes bacterium]|nr:DUF1854 domain-containing protein [Armatimonadota bacterium]
MSGRAEIEWLEADKVKIRRAPNGLDARLMLSDRCYMRAEFARAQPFSDPYRYISALLPDGEEIGMFRDLRGMDHESLATLEAELDRRYFIPKISRINLLREEFGLLKWDVETDRGNRLFFCRNWRDNVHELTSNRYLIWAMDGNRYEIPDYEALDEHSHRQVERLF